MRALVLNSAQVSGVLPMREAIEALRAAFGDLQRGEAKQPERIILGVGWGANVLEVLTMPSYLPRQNAMAIKISSIAPANRQRGLPLIHALVTLFDTDTGSIVALLEGASLTALRTGAMSGLATDLLARPDASRLAVIGAGAQARAQIRAVAAVRPLTSIIIQSRTDAKAHALAEWVTNESGLAVSARVVAQAEAAVSEADLVCLCTSTAVPDHILQAGWLRPGTHVNAIGGINEVACEFDPWYLQTAYVVVEERAVALAESGEVRQAIQAGYLSAERLIDAGEIVNGVAPGRASPSQITVFKSVGLAIQDAAVSRALYEKARLSGIGTTIEL